MCVHIYTYIYIKISKCFDRRASIQPRMGRSQSPKKRKTPGGAVHQDLSHCICIVIRGLEMLSSSTRWEQNRNLSFLRGCEKHGVQSCHVGRAGRRAQSTPCTQMGSGVPDQHRDPRTMRIGAEGDQEKCPESFRAPRL